MTEEFKKARGIFSREYMELENKYLGEKLLRRKQNEKQQKIIDRLKEVLHEMDGICDREMDYDNYCDKNGGRLTSPIAEIKAAIKVWRNHALADVEKMESE